MSFLSQNQLGKRPRQDSVGAESLGSGGPFITSAPQDRTQSRFQRTRTLGRMADGPSKSTSDHDGDEVEEEDEVGLEADDDSDEQGGYNVEAEPFPEHAVFDTGINECKAQALALVESIADILKQHSNNSVDLENMLTRALEASEVPDHMKKIVGLLGETGSGMSGGVHSRQHSVLH